MHAFNQSLSYDKRMYDQDIRGSIAYTRSLALSGILTKGEEGKIITGLRAVGKEWADGIVRCFAPIELTSTKLTVQIVSRKG